jgi:outer membrane lipoprotein SlyB
MKLKTLSVALAALFLAGCQTVSYVPQQQIGYDAYGNPYYYTTQTPVVVDNTNQVAGAALIGGALGLAAGAAIANNNGYYNRGYYRGGYYYNRGYYNRGYYNRGYYNRGYYGRGYRYR